VKRHPYVTLSFCALLTMLVSGSAMAADYPDHAIKAVVPFPAGSPLCSPSLWSPAALPL